ncbi:MAG: phosphoglycerate dehydrogenase [Rhodanobacteraceae bacterium]
MASKFRIATYNAISARGLERFPAAAYAVAKALADPDAILLRSHALQLSEVGGSVKAVGRAGAGVNNIPVVEMSKRGVPVFNAPGANANAVKELVIAGMLLAARNLPDALAFSQSIAQDGDAHARMEAEKKRFAGSELAGKTLGVVGLGAIGVRVANAAFAMGMRVVGFDPHMTVEGAWQLSSSVQRATSLEELYGLCDYVSVHVPLSDATRGMLGASAVDAVKPGMVLLNFAREAIVDAVAIRTGLDEGKLGRYVCDFPVAELADHPRVIALPHLGASTAEAEENCAVMVADQLCEFLESGNVQHSVNFPNTRMARTGHARICIANANRPNMIGQLTHILGEAGLNISQMHNASRGELAYNLIDVDAAAPDSLIATITGIDGILSLRVIAADA